jgi:peptide deformylase
MKFKYENTFNLNDLGSAPLKIYTYPAPVLKMIAKEVTLFDDELTCFVQDMTKTMYLSRGIGLAAPQVGKSIRLFISDIDFEFDEEDEEVVLQANPQVYINPKIIHKEGESVQEEGCLSFPGIYEKVTRSEIITMEYQDITGNVHQVQASGLQSICLQHELDHLNGIVFIEKLSPLKQSFLKRKFLKSKKK